MSGERSPIANRIQKVLENCNIKLGSVVSNVLGISGREMLDALIAGETEPDKLANLARGLMRKKIPVLRLALAGYISDHQRPWGAGTCPLRSDRVPPARDSWGSAASPRAGSSRTCGT
jgi:hypothetical protein